MSLNKGKEVILTVLCPNGRRVKIKCTQTTCVGQVIEEACLKHLFDPLAFNAKHLKRVLDSSSTLQYANIPNHAQLELVDAPSRRTEGLITVHLVIESGEKLVENFPSSTTLWDILQYHESNNTLDWSLPPLSSDLKPLLVYTMRKIKNEELKTVTLKSLGLYRGKCIMRYSVENSTDSLNVSGNPILQPSKNIASSAQEIEHASSISMCVAKPNQTEATQSLSSQDDCITDESKPSLPGGKSKCAKFHHDFPSQMDEPRTETVEIPTILPECDTQLMDCEPPNIVHESHCEESSAVPEVSTEVENQQDNRVIPLSDHDSILFSLDDAPSSSFEECDDDIFNLTFEEVRKLHKEQIDFIKEFEEQPLMTQQMRQLEEDTRLLSAMSRYPVTQIRLCFPDRYVVQANFKPRSTVREVMDFLRPLLCQPTMNFYLYLNFPRRILAPEMNLVEAGCIPKARIYFGSENALNHSFLSQETLSKKSSFVGASKAVLHSKNVDGNRTMRNVERASSLEKNGQKTGAIPKQKGQAQKNKPKWFTLGNK